MDLNNNVIETAIPVLSSTASASLTSVHRRQEPTAGEDEESVVCSLRDHGNRRVHETSNCDSESQWTQSDKREADPADPCDTEQADLIAVEEMRDDIELIVDLYLLVENTRWLFRCLLW